MSEREKQPDPTVPSSFTYASLIHFFTCNSLFHFLAYWNWIDSKDLGHIMKSNSGKNCDGHTQRKQDKGNLIRNELTLTVT